MKRQSLVLLAVAFLAAGAAGCFSDPVSSLQKGPALLELDHQSVFLATGDSVPVVATLKDKFGDALPAAGATWTSADPTVAVVRLDSTVVPGNYFTRAFIRGVTVAGGTTNVIVSARGLSDSVRVTVLPTAFSGAQLAFEGTAKSDTIGSVAFQAPDTLVVNGSNVLGFDSASVSAYVNSPTGKSTGYLIKRSSSQIKVVFTQPAMGRLVLKNLVLTTGNANVGSIALDSLVSDSVLVSRVRFNGPVTQAGDTTTVTAVAPYSFSNSTGVTVGSVSGAVLSRSSSAISFLTTKAGSGALTLSNAKLSGVTLPSVSADSTFTTTAATFPGAVTLAGDTMTIAAGRNATFDTTKTSVSIVDSKNGTKSGAIFAISPTQIRLLVPASTDTTTGYSGTLSVKNVLVSGSEITLPTTASYTINGARFPGTATVLGDTMTVTVLPATNITFDTSKTAVTIDSTPGVTLALDADSISVIALAADTGKVHVTHVTLGAVTLTLRTALNSGIAAATFPGAITAPGPLLGTIVLASTANMKFDTASGEQSSVTISGTSPASGCCTAFVVSLSPDTMKVISEVGNNAPITINNVLVDGAAVPSLTTTSNVVVSGTNTGEVTGNVDGPTADSVGITGPGTYYIYGAANDSNDETDYYKFTLTASSPQLNVQLSFPGDGSGDSSNPGMDLVLCKTLTSAGTCTYQLDLLGGAASVTTQPEVGSAGPLSAGTYYLAVFTRATTSGNVAYQIQVKVQ